MTYELYYSPDNARLHAATKTAELAERIAIIEKAIGSTPMQSGVRRTSRNSHLLQVEYVDSYIHLTAQRAALLDIFPFRPL